MEQETKKVDIHSLPDFLTVEEVAEYLRISRNSAYAAVRSGVIPSIRVGRLYRIPKAKLIQLQQR